jgi:2,3-bisphosphoglycerate-independent phosphoglycerate mutase
MGKVFLCILDGFGLGNEDYKYNAVFRANMPNLRRFLKEYPHSQIKTSGLSVGLPEGQMGNSEVGHMTIGSGRVLMQDLPLISRAIETGEIWKKEEVLEMLSHLKLSGGALHLLGLCSGGGVHSHVSHMHSFANFFAENGVKVFIHAISDGRDVPPQNFLSNLEAFENSFHSSVKIASLCGRFFTMDRDKKLERTEVGVNLILKAEGERFESLRKAVENAYLKGETDEFIKPCAIGGYNGANTKDILFFANFRADRARQVTQAILDNCLFKKVYTMMHYSSELSHITKPLFKKQDLKNTLGEVISKAGMRQFRIAETEKYAHITFFFNGGKEEVLKGEERLIIPSPKVQTYDLKPEMSLPEVEAKLLEVLGRGEIEFVACNVANGDMVGHTGNFEASKKASDRIDEFLGKMEEVCLKNGYTMLITADHGNLEQMLDENGIIHTQHTALPVPFFVLSQDKTNFKVRDGSLANIAPTILKLLGLAVPEEMEADLLG